MDTPRRRLSNRAIAGIIAGVLLLLGAGLWLEIRITANRAWAAMEKQTREMITEARARPGGRPVLRGTAESGNAWTDYLLALRDMEGIKSEIPRLSDYLRRSADAGLPETVKWMEKQLGTLDHLLRGARRAEGSYPYEWERGGQALSPNWYLSAGLTNLARQRARMLLKAGRPGESADLLLATLQFAGDCRRNATILPDVTGLSMMGEALRELRALMASGRCSPEGLAEIARQLEILDGSWADSRNTSRNEMLTTTIDLLAKIPGTTFIEEATTLDWIRFGFSYRLMAADAAARNAWCAGKFIEMEPLAWQECLVRRWVFEDERKEWRNPLAPYGFECSIFSNREKRAQLRLVRVEAHYRATGKILDLKDPFGDRLRLEVKDGKTKVWSLGLDGIDEGGKGTWEIGQARTDIVVELAK